MRVDLRLSASVLALAISTAVHGQSFSFTPAASASAARQGTPLPAPAPAPAAPGVQSPPARGAPASDAGPAASAAAPAAQPATVVTSTEDLSATPDIAAMIATMSTKAPTVATLAEVARREREIALAERYAKIKAATAPRVPVDAVPQVKVIKPVVRQPLVAPEAPLKHVLAIYGAPGREEADLLLADGSIQTVQRGTRGEGFEVLSVSRDAVRVSVSRQVVAKGSGHKGRGRDELKTVRSTLDVPVGTAFH